VLEYRRDVTQKGPSDAATEALVAGRARVRRPRTPLQKGRSFTARALRKHVLLEAARAFDGQALLELRLGKARCVRARAEAPAVEKEARSKQR
jgi:hypothetical protein